MSFKIVRKEEDINIDIIIPNDKEKSKIDLELSQEEINMYYEKCLIKAVESGKTEIGIRLIYSLCENKSRQLSLKSGINILKTFCENSDLNIYLILPDDKIRYSDKNHYDLEDYFTSHYIGGSKNNGIWGLFDDPMFVRPTDTIATCAAAACTWDSITKSEHRRQNSLPEKENSEIKKLMDNVGETFQQRLFRFIDELHRDDVEVYKGARKDKKLFSKIRSNINYQPSKHTVFAFAVSLKLSLAETNELLSCAGLAISKSSKFDIIMQYVFEKKIYDIDQIDYILCDYGQEKYIF